MWGEFVKNESKNKELYWAPSANDGIVCILGMAGGGGRGTIIQNKLSDGSEEEDVIDSELRKISEALGEISTLDQYFSRVNDTEQIVQPWRSLEKSDEWYEEGEWSSGMNEFKKKGDR